FFHGHVLGHAACAHGPAVLHWTGRVWECTRHDQGLAVRCARTERNGAALHQPRRAATDSAVAADPVLDSGTAIRADAACLAGRRHALARYTQSGRYGLAVFEGYITSDPTVPRDAHEEDDFCDAADARGLAVTLPGGSFRDTLTIDNPHDIDWIKFRVTGVPAVTTIKIAAVTSAATVDSSDVDLFLLTVPG